jgi:hypothetical protein
MNGTICIRKGYLCVRAGVDASVNPASGLPERQFIFLPVCSEGSEADYRSRQRSWNPEDTEGNGDLGRRVVSYASRLEKDTSSWYPEDGPFHTAYWRVKGGPLQDREGNMLVEYDPIPRPKVKKGVEVRWSGLNSCWEKLLKKGWVMA